MPTEFYLVGDSHSAVLGRAARELGMEFRGGPVTKGRDLNELFFRIEGDRFILTCKVGAGRAAQFADLLTHRGPVLSTVGFNTHNFIQLAVRHEAQTGCSMLDLSSGAFHRCACDSRTGALAFYRAMAEYGKQVFYSISPQIFSSDKEKELGQRFERALIRELQTLGMQLLDVRSQTCDSEGKLRPELQDEIGKVHASPEFARIVLGKFEEAVMGANDSAYSEAMV